MSDNKQSFLSTDLLDYVLFQNEYSTNSRYISYLYLIDNKKDTETYRNMIDVLRNYNSYKDNSEVRHKIYKLFLAEHLELAQEMFKYLVDCN